ncbi:DNA damage-inducible transcript 4-like protein [Acanthaster planci]|uniref:DNA damage-inducible transcript 4-like protein n=1 Tax=Acanthaster planci TaxID=133434 RepID=A0A8B7Z5E9_ACAPL|nr:DNA damage-inducible transcript 4-like protein [Acanthaster planci]
MDGAMALHVKANCDQQGVATILQKIFHKFGEKIEPRDNQKWHEPNYVIETVRGSVDSNSDFHTMDVYGGNEIDDIREVKMSQYVASLILDCLRNAREKQQPTKLLVPDDLPQRVADDVMRMALDEPCGVRGCSLSVILEDGEICQRVGKIVVDPSTVTTFEIVLVLTKETPRWLFSKLQTYLRNSNDRPTVIKSSYKLIKRKLYRRESHMYIREGL